MAELFELLLHDRVVPFKYIYSLNYPAALSDGLLELLQPVRDQLVRHDDAAAAPSQCTQQGDNGDGHIAQVVCPMLSVLRRCYCSTLLMRILLIRNDAVRAWLPDGWNAIIISVPGHDDQPTEWSLVAVLNES